MSLPISRRNIKSTAAAVTGTVLVASVDKKVLAQGANSAMPENTKALRVIDGNAGEPHQTSSEIETTLTTNQGVPIADDVNSLRVGERGPTLMEDFIFREKMTHFDHERIPERVVHARGTGAHGYFELTDSLAEVSRADIFQKVGQKTPVFVRFSTVAGNRGSSDLARDVRGFAVKFYTQQGNWDLVGNNIPVFFIQDAITFPDFVHAVKEEPDRGFPQAQSAHDTFWDFISLTPESMHMIMWVMSDRAVPRSLRMMEGFGVHTFRLVSKENKNTYVKFHWRPKLGSQSVLWDEAVKINGADPDFHRRDLWNAIEQGDHPEWELGVQLFDDKFAEAFDFDVLDATKLIPEEILPLRIIGRMVLTNNPVNVFSETEQVAFCTSHVVPGIDFTNDPLLQGRNFSYLDTQLKRLGGPNFAQLPINQPRCPMHNFQRDGHMNIASQAGRVSYQPSALNGAHLGMDPKTGYTSFPARNEGDSLRVRAKRFSDHYSQARQFYVSQSKPEQEHIIDALTFELSKVETEEIRTKILAHLANIEDSLAKRVADGLGYTAEIPAVQAAVKTRTDLKESPLLSILKKLKPTLRGRMIGLLVGEGANAGIVEGLRAAAEKEGADFKIIAPKVGGVTGSDGKKIAADFQLAGGPSVLFDAVGVVTGKAGADVLAQLEAAVSFVHDAFSHRKVIAGSKEAQSLMAKAGVVPDEGVIDITSKDVTQFIDMAKKGRNWERAVRIN